MIRFFLGFFFVFGAIGNVDYAMQAGLPEPPMSETVLLVTIGFGLMYFGLKRVKEVYGED